MLLGKVRPISHCQKVGILGRAVCSGLSEKLFVGMQSHFSSWIKAPFLPTCS